jgi:hypothetical protein
MSRRATGAGPVSTSAGVPQNSTRQWYGFVLALAKQAVAAFQLPKTCSDVLLLGETGMGLLKIISGQTGLTRRAGLALGVSCGGWCPN